MRTNHMMIPDNKGRVYCNKKQKVIKFDGAYFKKNCVHCKYMNGIGDGGEVAIECLYNDGSDSIAVEVRNPEELIVNDKEMGFKK